MKAITTPLALVATVALFTMTACADNGDSDGTTTVTAATTTAASPGPGTAITDTIAETTTVTASQTPGTGVDNPDPSVPATQPLGTPGLGRTMQPPEGAYDLTVTDVRMAEHESFTRVVFDFHGTGMPGWWVGYTAEATQQASGLPVEVAGDSFLEVSLDGIALPPDAEVRGVDMGSFGGAGIVDEVVLTTIFEARAQFFIGVSGHPREYSITLLQEPTRVVVDLVH